MKADQWAHVISEHGAWMGAGVRPGETKPLCWWRKPRDEKFSVLYADLTLRDEECPPKSK